MGALGVMGQFWTRIQPTCYLLLSDSTIMPVYLSWQVIRQTPSAVDNGKGSAIDGALNSTVGRRMLTCSAMDRYMYLLLGYCTPETMRSGHIHNTLFSHASFVSSLPLPKFTWVRAPPHGQALWLGTAAANSLSPLPSRLQHFHARHHQHSLTHHALVVVTA